jgi:serine/threonine protein kinase
MFTSDPDPTATCSVSLVTDPAQLDKKRNAQENIFLDDTIEEKAKDAVVVGHYQLLTQLGKGSTGVVWKAVDLGPVRREVALKILHSDYQDDHARIRFTNEVRALACLDDPHIAKVWDDGQTPDGRPFLAMELVPGLSLLKYCDTWSLTIAERLELVIKICEGIQHAHQRAILHRDLKPANILVALVDGQPVPKIIDFGLAKSLHGPLAPAAVETTQRGCLIGTIGYMSPEQAELDQRDVDVRSDVYAIAAILYELLTGTLPITREELHRHSLTEALKLVREQEPDLPSHRVDHEPSSSLHAARCRLNVTALAERLSGDLDAILMKGLAKDRFLRYQSVSELADDLKRYLEGRVVQARKRTYWYVTQKWLRKHWKAAAVLSIVATLFLISWAMTITGYFQVLEERNEAQKARTKADVAKAEEEEAKEDSQLAYNFLRSVFGQIRPGRQGSQTTLLEALDGSVTELREKVDGRPRAACMVRWAMAKAYLSLDRAAKANILLEPWINFWFEHEEDRRQFLAPVQETYIQSLVELGRTKEAAEAAQQFLRQYPSRGEARMRESLMAVRQQLVRALTELGEFERAHTVLAEATRTNLLSPNDKVAWTARDFMLQLHVNWCEADPKQIPAALKLAEDYIKLAEHPGQNDAPPADLLVFSIKLKVVSILVTAGRHQEALELLERLTERAADSSIIRSQNPLAPLILQLTKASIHSLEGDLDTAEPLFHECLLKVKEQCGPEHRLTQLAVRSVIDIKLKRGDYWAALPYYAQLRSFVGGKASELSMAASKTQIEFEQTVAKAALQWALWGPR